VTRASPSSGGEYPTGMRAPPIRATRPDVPDGLAGVLDRMHLEYFSDSLIDQSVRAWLAPYVALKVG